MLITYSFKPRKELADAMAHLATEIKQKHKDLAYLNISRLFEFSAHLLLKEYPLDEERVVSNLRDYFSGR